MAALSKIQLEVWGRKSFKNMVITELQSYTLAISGVMRGLTINPANDRLFVLEYSSSNVHQYNLSAPNDLTISSTSSKYFGITQAYSCGFSNNGLNLYSANVGGNSIYRVVLSTAFDVSTIGTRTGLNTGVADAYVWQTEISLDGFTLYRKISPPGGGGGGVNLIKKYTLSTAFDITTATLTNTYTLDGNWFYFIKNGKYILVGREGWVRLYKLGIANDLSTIPATYIQTTVEALTGSVACLSTDENYLYLGRVVASGNNKIIKMDLNIF